MLSGLGAESGLLISKSFWLAEWVRARGAARVGHLDVSAIWRQVWIPSTELQSGCLFVCLFACLFVFFGQLVIGGYPWMKRESPVRRGCQRYDPLYARSPSVCVWVCECASVPHRCSLRDTAGNTVQEIWGMRRREPQEREERLRGALCVNIS